GAAPAPAAAGRPQREGAQLRPEGERDRGGELGRLHAAGAAQLPAHPAAGGGRARAPAAAPLRSLPPEDAGGVGHAHPGVTATPAPAAGQPARRDPRPPAGEGAPGRGWNGAPRDPPGRRSPPWGWPRGAGGPEGSGRPWGGAGVPGGGSRASSTNKGILVTRPGLRRVLGGWAGAGGDAKNPRCHRAGRRRDSNRRPLALPPVPGGEESNAPRRSHVTRAAPHPSRVTCGGHRGRRKCRSAAAHVGRRSVAVAGRLRAASPTPPRSPPPQPRSPGPPSPPRPAPAAPAAAMGASGSKSRGLWPFASPAAGGGGAEGPGGQQALARARAARAATPFVFTRRGSMYYDEDGDLAHEFYEETIVTKNGRKRAKLKRIHKNLIPQGIVKLEHPRIHVDFPVIICEV
uniref:Tumor suppressor candidate 2 n=3 Tax=Telluraves TaxID=3073808 RepID=A0A8B9MZA0_9AVES